MEERAATGSKAGNAAFGRLVSNRFRDWSGTLLTCWTRAIQLGRVIIGVPDYNTYLQHLRKHHPERVPMSYEQFFLDRQAARYKGGGGRCC